ncbi:hypothetical protein ACUNV4_29510 [Granulosicoccus sp. 3-233]|uniref:hypothetical protein n=1 Tax=Granulosicoccus sp. 3-233 TaxID=3417969 RepID=UPI003D338681
MALEDVTRGDLEQLFANQAELFTKEFVRLEKKMDDGFASVDERFGEVHQRFDRLEKQTHEDILTLFQEVERIKRHVGLKDKMEA